LGLKGRKGECKGRKVGEREWKGRGNGDGKKEGESRNTLFFNSCVHF